MKTFVDESGTTWVASAREEQTPRHHGRWYLVFHHEGDESNVIPMQEVRWQSRATAERTLLTMSEFELRRRIHTMLERLLVEEGASPVDGAPVDQFRIRTNVNAG